MRQQRVVCACPREGGQNLGERRQLVVSERGEERGLEAAGVLLERVDEDPERHVTLQLRGAAGEK